MNNNRIPRTGTPPITPPGSPRAGQVQQQAATHDPFAAGRPPQEVSNGSTSNTGSVRIHDSQDSNQLQIDLRSRSDHDGASTQSSNHSRSNNSTQNGNDLPPISYELAQESLSNTPPPYGSPPPYTTTARSIFRTQSEDSVPLQGLDHRHNLRRTNSSPALLDQNVQTNPQRTIANTTTYELTQQQ